MTRRVMITTALAIMSTVVALGNSRPLSSGIERHTVLDKTALRLTKKVAGVPRFLRVLYPGCPKGGCMPPRSQF